MAATAGRPAPSSRSRAQQRLRRPYALGCHGLGGQAVEGGAGHGFVELGRRGGGPQGERGVGGGGRVGNEGHLTVPQHQAGLERVVPAPGPPGGTGEPGFQATPAVVVGPGDATVPRPARARHQGVGVGEAQGRGHGVLVLEQQGVGRRVRWPGAARRARPRWCRRPSLGRGRDRRAPRPGRVRPGPATAAGGGRAGRPCASLRSGSSRKARSPKRWWRCRVTWSTAGSQRPARVFHCSRARVEHGLGQARGRRRRGGRRAARGPP